MERFPVELISRICSYLCMHCNDPDAFPHADTAEAILAKASLARFARSSKYIHAIAHPYVFHYYATGNMIRFIASASTGCATDMTRLAEQHENDHLPLFLRSIIRRPALATHVKALQLIVSANINDLNKADKLVLNRRLEDTTNTSVAFRMIRRASETLDPFGFNLFNPSPHFRNPSMAQGHIALTLALAAKTPALSGQSIHHNMEELAIFLCPNVSILAHGTTFADYSCWHLPKRDYSPLKKLGLLSHDGGHHFTTAQSIIRYMPNVETLYSADLNCPWPEIEGRYAMGWMHKLQGVRKLVLSDIPPLELESMIKLCPQLSDLEYRHHGYFNKTNSIRGDWLLWALMPAQKTLRRLFLTSMADGDPRGDLNPVPLESLADFEGLQELAINQIYLDRSSNSDTPNSCGTDLAEFLPRSIRDIHIMYVWMNLTADLENLARDAPKELPNLRSVRISHLDFEGGRDNREAPDSVSHDQWFPVLEGQYEGVQKSFAAASVLMTWDKLRYKIPRQKLTTEEPAAPGSYISTPYSFWESPERSHML
jgi:hypothetical protein